MPVVQVQLPDGRVVPVEVPESPAAQQEATKSSLSGLKDAALSGGKSLARGFLGGLAGLAEGAAAFNFADRMGRTPTPGREMTAGVEKMLPIPKEESTFEKLSRKGLEGIGGAFAAPVPGAMAANAIAGGVGGVTGELGRSFGERAGPIGEVAGQVVGGALGGGLAGFLAGPKQSIGQADIRRELAGLPDDQWNTARNNVDLFTNSGSTTATLADAFPGKPRIAALAGKASNMKGGELLAQRLAGREDDLQNLGQETLRRMGPEVDANAVANSAGGAATANLLQSKRQATNAVTNQLAGVNVPAPDVFDIYTNLRNVSATAERRTIADAYDEVANRLLNQQGQPITNLQELSFAIKDLKDGMKNPLAPPRGGTAAMDQALTAVENAFRARFPEYRRAMEGFARDQAARTEVKQGPIGTLADKNPLTAGQTPVARLEGIMTGNSPQTIRQTVSALGSPAMTSGNPANPQSIATALAQQKLRKGSTDPGKTVRGAPGSLEARQFQALLEQAGMDVGNVTAPLRAADQLQNLGAAGAVGGFPEMRSGQAVIRPFRTLDMMMTGKTERDTQREISRLLADPTPAGLARLREIAMFDPNLRRQLTLIAALRPGLFGNTSQEQ